MTVGSQAALEELARRIASGELVGDHAFEAIVDAIAATVVPADAGPQLAGQIRSEVVLGVSNDQALCRILNRARPEDRPPAPVERRSAEVVPTRPPAAVATTRRKAEDHRDPSARPRPGGDRALRARRKPLGDAPASRSRARARRPNAEATDEFAAAQRRSRVLVGLGAAAVVALLGAGWFLTRADACDALAADVCRRLPEGDCRIAEVKGRLREQGVAPEVCADASARAQAAIATVDNARAGRTYRATLTEVLGFDPRGEASSEPPAQRDPAAFAPMAILTGLPPSSSLFVDRAHLYWTTPQPPGVHRARNVGGAVETLATHPDPDFVTASDDFVYWLSRAPEGPTMWADKKRGDHEPQTITLEGVEPIVARFLGPEVVFVDGITGAISIVAVAGGPPRTLVPSGADADTALAADAELVYFATAGEQGQVASVPRAGGAITVLASRQPMSRSLEVDDRFLYWIEGESGSVMRVAKTGGPAQALVSAQAQPTDLALDDTRVYWTNATEGTVLAVDKAGGEIEVLASGQQRPTLVVVDGAAVYWRAGDTIWRKAK